MPKYSTNIAWRLPNITFWKGSAVERPELVSSSYERIPYPNLDGMKKLRSMPTSTNPKLAPVRPETVMDASFINKLEQSGFIQSVYKKR